MNQNKKRILGRRRRRRWGRRIGKIGRESQEL